MPRHRQDDHAAIPAQAAREPERERPARKKSRAGRILGETVLTLLAVFGFICAALAIAAWTMNIGIILFKTGSMAPEIPAGSMAIVRTIPAEQAQIGDVRWNAPIRCPSPTASPPTPRIPTPGAAPTPASSR